jgi:hypothetical protein
MFQLDTFLASLRPAAALCGLALDLVGFFNLLPAIQNVACAGKACKHTEE